MSLGFVHAKKAGQHFELAEFAVNKLKSANLLLKSYTEKEYEHLIISHLQSSAKLRKNLITQIGEDEVEKITNTAVLETNCRSKFIKQLQLVASTGLKVSITGNSYKNRFQVIVNGKYQLKHKQSVKRWCSAWTLGFLIKNPFYC